MRWGAGRNKEDAIEPQNRECVLGYNEVAYVRRIERTTEETEFHRSPDESGSCFASGDSGYSFSRRARVSASSVSYLRIRYD